jgi:phosphate acetyltransferase
LAEIAVESAKTAELFDIEPKVAMMSFSTKGSAKSRQRFQPILERLDSH